MDSLRLPCWAIDAQMSSGRQRFLAYVSARRKAAARTHNVQARIRRSRDAPGQMARYARTEMKDPAAALAGWVSRAPLWLRALSLRRDLALPLVVLAVQITWTAVGGWKMQVFSQPRPPGALDWVLLVAGPVALVARRRHPLAVLWVSLAATFASPWLAHASFVVAFFVAAINGKRYPAWTALAVGFAWTIWLAPVIYRRPIPPVNDAAARGVDGGACDRSRGDPGPGRASCRDQGYPSGRAAPSAERGAAAGREGSARRDRSQHLAHQRPGQHGT